MRDLRSLLTFVFLVLITICISGCSKDKTIKDIVKEGKDSYMTGTWDITFTKYTDDNIDSPTELNKMTVIISNTTDVHNNRDLNEVELITYDLNNKESKETKTFEELLSLLDEIDKQFYIKHDIKKLERKNPSAKYSLKGSRFAKRDNKNLEYDEIIAKQSLIEKSKDNKNVTTILFEMEKRIRNK